MVQKRPLQVDSKDEILTTITNKSVPIEKKILKIREIFYSLQGEGGRAGQPSIFIRLSYCNKNCWFCDTDWSQGIDYTVEKIAEEIKQYKGEWILWTGGEPTLQLTSDIVDFFKKLGYKQAIESNGSNSLPEGLDYITISPKVPPSHLKKVIKGEVDEIRYPISAGQKPPAISSLPKSKRYYVSPVFLGEEKKRFDLDEKNLKYCIDFCLENPEWSLSIQQHKIWNVR